jgi:ubiquitin carboxyl-terminal hydrolase 7
MQDARKGVLFESFPPVLQLQLKRFEYDFMRDVMVKVSWRQSLLSSVPSECFAPLRSMRGSECWACPFFRQINDRYEFPDELDLDVGNGKYLSPNADRKVRNRYRLHSVLVHSGGVHGGHYYAFIRPSGEQWYRFEDERVTKEDDKRALDEQFGEDDNATPGGFNNNLAFKVPKYSNAYMLVYIRVEDWDRIQCGVAEADIAEPLRVRLKV